MAPTHGREAADLEEHLFAEPYRYEFFQAVRLHQRARPGAELGSGDDPRRETLRFGADISLGFPASDIHSLDAGGAEGVPDHMEVCFLGVATPASFGSLPTPYAEAVLSDLRDGHGGAKAFYDLFNHRLISMFYRAWTKYRPEILYETAAPGQVTPFERAIFAMLGISDRERTANLPFDARGLLSQAGALRRRGTTADSLAELIEDYFGVPAAVESFCSRAYGLEPAERSRLGRQASELGESLTLGARVEIAQYAFGLSLGPLSVAQFADFLPAGAGHAALTALTRLAVGPEFDYSITLRLAEGEASPCRLGGGEAGAGSQLGWSSWLRPQAAASREQRVTLAAG